MFDSFAWTVALRNLRTSAGQTLLTTGVVAISAALVIFLSALVRGTEKRMVGTTTDSIAHIVIEPFERVPLVRAELDGAEDGAMYIVRRVRLQPVRARMDDWRFWLPQIENFDSQILSAAPVIEGQCILIRGAKQEGVRAIGMDPARYDPIVGLSNKMASGRFIPLNSGEAAIGQTLAERFGVGVGDRVYLQGPGGKSNSLLIAGIYSAGSAALDDSTVMTSLRDGQALFQLGQSINSIKIKISDVFQAAPLAARLSAYTPYQVKSWMGESARLLAALKAQRSSSDIITLFAAMAAAFAVAAVMIVAVMTRLPEIGVLKAMGASPKQIFYIFLIQGALLTTLGAIAGIAAGAGFTIFLGSLRAAAAGAGPKPMLFTIIMGPGLFIGTAVVSLILGVISSLYPSLRAARVNPIEVIRGH